MSEVLGALSSTTVEPAFDSAPTSCGRFEDPRWYCVATNAGQQFLAEHELSADRWRCFFPLHLDRSTRRIVPMFPGYGFVEFDAGASDWPRICRTRGVYRILGDLGRPRPLPVGAIEDLRSRTSARRIVDDPGENFGAILPGARVKVVDGPLVGWEGVCTMAAPGRVRLLMGMFGGSRQVEFKREMVASV